MLTEFEQKIVWEGWLSSEIRANYFADLCHRYRVQQSVLSWLILASSSGAFAAVIKDFGSGAFRSMLAFFPVALSLWSLVAQNQKNSTDCSDLHFRWNRLSSQYESLWADMYSEEAPSLLGSLKEKSAELSKTGAGFPNKLRLMEKWQDYVVHQHAADVSA
jgi:hypothetical protein